MFYTLRFVEPQSGTDKNRKCECLTNCRHDNVDSKKKKQSTDIMSPFTTTMAHCH